MAIGYFKIGIMVTTLGFVILFFMFFSDTLSAETITVDDDGDADYENIQDAIDNATEGDIVRVWDGYYNESLVVNKSISLIGNGSETTTIDGGKISDDVVSISADWVNMRGFSVTANRYYGTGIMVTSKFNNISNNSIDMINSTGIYLYYSSSCQITNNILIDSGILIEGDLENWNSHVIEYNQLNGKPVYYYKDTSDFTVPLGAGQVILANCTGVIVEGQNCSNGSVGILVGYSTEITIENNICTNNVDWKGWGISLDHSNNCTITNNTCINNRNGINIDSCEDIDIENNTCLDNHIYGINIEDSIDCLIMNNSCDNNTWSITLFSTHNSQVTNNICMGAWYCIYIDSSSNSTIMNNTSLNSLKGICLSSSNYCTIKNNICSDNGEGILLSSSSDCTIISNVCGNNMEGIRISSSSNNCLIKNNSCSENTGEGIDLVDSDYCTLEMNTCDNNQYGIYIISSQYSTIRNNTMSGNGIFIRGSLGEWSHHVIEPSNLVNGKPVLYYSNTSDLEVPMGAGQIILAKCSRIVIEDQNCSNATAGILVGYSKNITIENTICRLNIYGIRLYYSDYCRILRNTCENNEYGIHLHISNHIVIMNNTCENNYFGIRLWYSLYGTIENNTCRKNNYGIFLDPSRNCKIVCNTVSENLIGIRIKGDSQDCEVHYNNIYDNTQYGIEALKINDFPINTTNNWWGDKSGPYHPTNNSEGTGDNVTDSVIFDPWLEEYYTPSDQSDDEPDRFLLHLILIIIASLFIALEIVVRAPDSVFGRKRSQTPPLPKTGENQVQKDSVTSKRRSITCKYCNKTFDIGENEKAIRIPCPNCGKNILR